MIRNAEQRLLVYPTATGALPPGRLKIHAPNESEPCEVTAEAPHQAVTGNRLRDGVPIYFAGNGTWSAAIGDAVVAPDGGVLLAEASKGPLPLEAVGPYVIDVTVADGAVNPIGLKEQIRAFGPTA
jgi:Protein of unknown function (DUF2849)